LYLEQRRRRWYACHDIPANLQGTIGRRRFVQSLETEDRKTAQRRAAILAVRWLSEIEKARTGTPDHLEKDALYWRKVLEDIPEELKEVAEEAMVQELRATVDRAAAAAGIVDDSDPAYEELPEFADIQRKIAIATGKLVRLDEHLEEYLATLSNEAKTVDMKRSSILKFCHEFPYIQDVKRKEVQRWVNKQGQEGKAIATIRRSLSELRGYWAYLVSIEAASENNMPFEKLAMPKASKKDRNGEDRKPFKPAEVVKLLNAAEERGDRDLADLIRLGMWTGARIEELCALKMSKVGDGYFDIEDAKTKAGWRQVPIHSELETTMGRLMGASRDGYVLSGLLPNKYGDRSNAIGKRFGRLKADLGFGPGHVFHSIRKTVATLLDNAGVPENVAADILGHDKPTMTYGLYSGGASLETKRKALELLDYRGV
jgi:integrase